MTKVYIETYGCALNRADSATMAGILEREGYELTNSPTGADFLIINTCTVKERTYLNFLSRLKELKNQETPFLITGCIPGVYGNEALLENCSYLGTGTITKVAEAVEKVLEGERVQVLDFVDERRQLDAPHVLYNPVIDIVPVSQGCVGNCAYCQTRLARGALRSFSIEQIVRRVETSRQRGIREIWLTSQDIGAYGLDIGTSIIELLIRILHLEGQFRIRIGMTNPEHILPILDEFLDIFTDARVFNFMHLPIQSGSDRILEIMNRKYRVADYMTIVERIRTRFEEFSIATDVIAGFPGETEKDFEQTLHVLKEINPAVVNRSKFSARPFTPAATMEQVPRTVINDRSREITQLVEEISARHNAHWLEWQGAVLVDMHKRRGSYISRNFAYKPIMLPLDVPENQSAQLGQFKTVGIIDSTTYHLVGKVI